MKICIVSSAGGHLSEVRMLRPVYAHHEHVYVLNSRRALPADMQGKTHFIRHSERDWLLLVNLVEAWRILRRERPQLILSCGAGAIVPFALVAKLLRIPVVFIEPAAQVTTPSLSGRIMYHLADRFFYQWPELATRFPRGVYGGPLHWSS